jgi:murein DD-endopeptidase MepM/ murein hydrolase activator NlpD
MLGGSLESANLALVRAREGVVTAGDALSAATDSLDGAASEAAAAERSLARATRRATTTRRRAEADAGRVRAFAITSYVSGGDPASLAVGLAKGSGGDTTAVPRVYTASAMAEAVRLRRASDEAAARAEQRRQAEEAVAREAEARRVAAEESQVLAGVALLAAQDAEVAATQAQERAMAAVWGGQPGSWRCDAGGRTGVMDDLRVLLGGRQAGQAFDASRAGSLLPPVPGYAPGSPFGWRVDPIQEDEEEGTTRIAWHEGVDIAAPSGTPVVAVADGVVVRVGDAGDGYGILVVVDHAGGLASVYAHLSQASVAPGAAVAAGSVIGRVGSTGRSTGPHLHFELRAFGAQCDPMWGWGAAPSQR